MSIKEYIRVLKRHKWWVISWFVFIVAVYIVFVNYFEFVNFQSTGEITIDAEEVSVSMGSRNDSGGNMDQLGNPDWYVPVDLATSGYQRDAESGVVLREAFLKYMEIARMNPDKNNPGESAIFQPYTPMFEGDEPTDTNLKKLKECIDVKNLNANGSKLRFQAKTTNPHKSKWLVEAWIQAFEEFLKDKNQKNLKKVLEQVVERKAERKELLEETVEHKKMLQDTLVKKYGEQIIWEDGADRKREERQEVQTKLYDVEKEILSLRSQIKELESYTPDQWMVEVDDQSKVHELFNGLFTQRQSLMRELERLRVDFTDKHPQVIKKMAELNSLNAEFPKLAENIIRNEVKKLGRQLANKNAIREKLLADLEKLNREIVIISENKEKFDDANKKIKRITSDTDEISRYIDQIRDKLASLSTPITKNALPKEGQRVGENDNMKYYMILFGILIGWAFIYLLENMDDTIRTAHDVEKYVGLRVIGTVPMLSKGEEKLLHRIALKSPISEMMNTLSMIIQSWMLRMKGQAILIVSSKPGEGKSTFVSNLSVALCRGGEKVVLIDGDLRKPSLHRFYGVDNSIGFSNYLGDDFPADVENTDEAKITKIVHQTDVEGLFLIPSGPIPPNPVGLLKSDRVERLLNHLKTYIDTIVVDSPPLAMIDAGVLSTKVSGVVTVMDAGKVSKKEALASKHLIENVGGNNLGVILNKVTLEGEEYYYYFEGYSYYYGNSRNRKKKRS